MNQFSLKGKTILITGASSGIGKATAQLCSQAGAKLVLLGRDEVRLEEVLNSLDGEQHSAHALDLTDFQSVEAFAKAYLKTNSPINGIVNAAGISTTFPFKYATPEKLEPFFQTNVYGAFNISRLFSKKTNAEGISIVFITSVMASVGASAKSIYGMTKGALVSGSKSLAMELAPRNIRVNCISPGVVETPLIAGSEYTKSEEAYKRMVEKHPLGIGKPDDVAHACIFLLSDASRWITGIDLKIDGGYTAQ